MNSPPIPQRPTWFDWITVAALIIGPFLALLAQRGLDYLREKRNQRVRLYLTLMSTRGAPLAPAHVEALNSIDVVFSGRRDRNIREKWKAVLDQLALDATQQGWNERLNDLRVDLFREVGLRVGYNFGVDYLKRQHYAPRYYADMELDQITIRQGLAAALKDKNGLRVKLDEPGP